MRLWIADGLMLAGGLVALLRGTSATVAYRRFFRATRAHPGDRKIRAISGVELAYWAGVAGMLTGGGLFVLIVGAISGSYLERQDILWPIGLIAGSGASAWLARHTLAQLHKSAEKENRPHTM